MTKEECVKYKEELKFAYGHIGTKLDNDSLRDCIILGIVGYEKLMKEHFEPKPYTFEELKPDMWVWDDKEKICCQIYSILSFDKLSVNYHYENVLEFKENRFYPVQKANQGV